MYKKLIAFFMSGTGNSFRAAVWVAEYFKKLAISSEINAIGSDTSAYDIPQNALLGVFMPTHGLTAPFSVIKFALGLPQGNGRHCFVVATRGAGTFGKDSPGCEGTASYLIALILMLKGYKVIGVMGLDMPPNWDVVHPSMSEKTIDYILNKSRKKIEHLADVLLSGKTHYKGFISLIIGIAFIPLSIAYLIMGKLFLSKLFFANGRCTGCGICSKICPNSAITMSKNKKPRPYWKYTCESCMRCMSYCPQKAIEAGHLWAVIVCSIALLPLEDYFYKIAGQIIHPNWWSYLLGLLVQYLAYLVLLALAYLLFNIAVRQPLINRFFSITTFTRYFKRYREPNTTVGDLTKRHTY